MVSTCSRCGATVRVVRKPRKGTVRLDFEADPLAGNVALAHGLALVQDPIVAARQRGRGMPMYSKHKCSERGPR